MCSSIRRSGSIRCDVCFSQVMRFLCELSPRPTMYELNWPASFLARRRACSTHIRVARVSRFDRQLRYYSEAFGLASVLSGYAWGMSLRKTKSALPGEGGRITPGKRKTPLRMEQRFGPVQATGLQNDLVDGSPPHLLQVFRPAFPFLGTALLAVVLAGACSSWLA